MDADRTLSEIALEMLDSAGDNAIRFTWVDCAPDYVRSRDFVKGMAERGHRLIARLPSDTPCRIVLPDGANNRPEDLTLGGLGALAKALPLRAFCWARPLRDQLERHPALAPQPWQVCRVEADGGSVEDWAVRRARCVVLSDRNAFDLPPMERLAYRPSRARFGAAFIVTTDTSATTEEIVRAAERACRAAWVLEEEWTRLGMGRYTGRSYPGLRRYLTLASLASWLRSSSPRGVDIGDPPLPARWPPSSGGMLAPDPTDRDGSIARSHQGDRDRAPIPVPVLVRIRRRKCRFELLAFPWTTRRKTSSTGYDCYSPRGHSPGAAVLGPGPSSSPSVRPGPSS